MLVCIIPFTKKKKKKKKKRSRKLSPITYFIYNDRKRWHILFLETEKKKNVKWSNIFVENIVSKF